MVKVLLPGLLCCLLLFGSACVFPSQAGTAGRLLGRVTVGPLSPVESADKPEPPPEVCRAQAFWILRAEDRVEVVQFAASDVCTFSVELGPGTYVLEYLGRRPAFTKDLPRQVEIRAGETTWVEIHVDTGIR